MSALLHLPTSRRSDQEQERGRLRAVSAPAGRLSRVPFLLVLAATLGLGMVGLLVLNTTVQTNAVEVRALESRLTTLSYTEAELAGRLDRAESPADLAGKASELGLRPNPYPAFIDLETGEVSGDPRQVEGDEMGALVTTSAAGAQPTAAERAAAEERADGEQAARDRAAAQEQREQQAQEKRAQQQAQEKKAEQQAQQKKAEQQAQEKKAQQQAQEKAQAKKAQQQAQEKKAQQKERAQEKEEQGD